MCLACDTKPKIRMTAFEMIIAGSRYSGIRAPSTMAVLRVEMMSIKRPPT